MEKTRDQVLDETKGFVIELHGRDNFEKVYTIMNKYVSHEIVLKYVQRDHRFSEENQKKILDEVGAVLSGESEDARKDLIGLVSSYMIIEDYNKENAAKH